MCITINREKIDELPHRINVKRVRRIMQILGLKSVIRRKRPDYIKSTPEITAENILNRDFKATVPFEKWLTDVIEFKYYVGPEVKKLYFLQYLTFTTDVLLHTSSVTATTMRSFLKRSMKQQVFIQMQNQSSTVTEDFNTPTKYFTKSSLTRV